MTIRIVVEKWRTSHFIRHGGSRKRYKEFDVLIKSLEAEVEKNIVGLEYRIKTNQERWGSTHHYKDKTYRYENQVKGKIKLTVLRKLLTRFKSRLIGKKEERE